MTDSFVDARSSKRQRSTAGRVSRIEGKVDARAVPGRTHWVRTPRPDSHCWFHQSSYRDERCCGSHPWRTLFPIGQVDRMCFFVNSFDSFENCCFTTKIRRIRTVPAIRGKVSSTSARGDGLPRETSASQCVVNNPASAECQKRDLVFNWPCRGHHLSNRKQSVGRRAACSAMPVRG